ncbi:hypothetical protein [Vreelandella venusta]|uniref:hypothetical protein n=1 Tax=Vreelandella venusta TaxID=44935 RepID=UPI003F66DD03
MSNNLTLSVKLTGDGKQLSGTLKDAQGDVREFSATTERESKKAETALTAPGRSAVTVSDYLQDAQREARAFGTETAQGGRQATRALTQTSNEAQTTTAHLDKMRSVALGVGAALIGAFGASSVINRAGLINDADALARSIGIATGELQAWDYAAQRTGLSAGTVGDIFKDVSDKVGDFAATGGGEAADLFENLNLQIGELQRLSPDQQLLKIADAISQIEDPSQRIFYLESLANDATRLLPLLEDNGAVLRELTGEAYSLGVAMNQVDIDNALQADRAMAQLRGTTQGFLNLLAADLGPALSDTVANLTELIQSAGGADQVLRTVTATVTIVGAAAGAYGTYRAVIASATVAQWAFNAAVRANPLGIAITLLGAAAGALYTYRDEVTLAGKESFQTSLDVDGLTSSFHLLTKAQQENKRASLTADLIEMRVEAGRLGSELVEVSRKVRNSGQLTPEGGALPIATPEDIQQGRELRQELAKLLNNIDDGTELLSKYDQAMAALGETTSETDTRTRTLAETNAAASKAADELAKSTEAQSDALEDLYNRLIPGRRETVQLARDMQTLTLAMAMGTGNIGQNIQAIGLLQRQYIEAQNDTDDLADKTVKAAFTMEGAFDELRLNGLRRLDDGFADMWLGAVDGSRNASDTIKRVWDQTLAELLHMSLSRPITVQLATSMGLNGGASGGAGGGFNGIGSLINGGKSLLGIGGGSTAAAAAGGLYSGASTGAAVGGLYGNAVTGGVASTGIMSSITAGVSAAMPWIAGGLAIDSLLGGGITKAISSIFGSRSRGPSFDLMTTDQDPNRVFEDVQHGVKARSAFGNIGFHGANTNRLQETFGSFGQATEFLEAIAASDDLLASLARSPEELNAMSAAVKEVRLQASDAAGITEQLGRRTAAAIGAMNSDFGALIDSAITQIADPERMTSALLAVLNIEGLIQSLNGQIQSDVTAHLEANTSNIQGTADSLTQAINATVLLGNSAQRLNLQFDDTAGGAIHYAWGLQEAVGGLDALNNMSASYYQNYFAASEREAMQREELTRTMQELGFELPETREGFRALMEAQNLNTTAGVQNAAALMQLEGAFAQLTPAVSEAGDAVRSTSDILQERAQLERELLQAQGDTNALRQLDLEALDESNRALQQMVWAEEKAAEDRRERERQAAQDQRDAAAARDAAQAYADAIRTAEQAVQSAKQQVQQSYQRFDQQSFDLQLGYLDLLGDSEAMLAMQRERELQTIDDSLRPFQERLWALQDEAKAQQQAREASRNYVSELERVRGELSGAFGNINGWIDQQQATGGTPEMNLANAQEQLARQLVLAENGDRSALQGITQYADRVLQANDAYNASSSAGQRVESDVINALKGLPKALSAEEFLAKEITDKLSEVITSFDDMIKLSLADEIERAVFASQYTIGALIDFAVGSNDLPNDLRTVLGQQAHRLDATISYLIGTNELDKDDRALALNVSNNLVSTVDQLLGSELTWTDKRLALNTTNTLSSTIDLTLGSDVSKETRKLALLNGNTLIATIDAVQSPRITADTRALALNQTNAIATDVNALLSSTISADAKALALNAYNDIATTVHTIIASDSSAAAMSLALNSTNSIRTFVRGLEHRLTDEDAKALALNSSNTLTATIQGVMASSIGDDAKKLALSKTNTLTTTIKAALADGALSRDERRLIDAQSETVVKTLKTNGGLNLTTDEWAVINAASGTQRLQLLADVAFGRADLDELGKIKKNTEDGGKSLAERAKDQVAAIVTLGGRMAESVDSIGALDGSITSLSQAIANLAKTQGALDEAKANKPSGGSGAGSSNTSKPAPSKPAKPSKPDGAQAYINRVNRFDDDVYKYTSVSMLADFYDTYPKSGFNSDNYHLGEALNNLRGMGAKLPDKVKDLDGWKYFANGGWTGPGGKYDEAGIVHAEEFVVRSEVVKQPGVRGMLESLNRSGVQKASPSVMPSYPLLGKSDVAELLRDLKREVAELRKENAKLQGESNKHLAAANTQRGAAAKGQIGAIERGNKMLKRLEDDKRLEAAKR